MSSSFLKPSVTPVTAFATRLRARPWNFPSAGSSRSNFATTVPSSCANTMPGGTYWFSLPLGPCTSTPPGTVFTVTPFGIGIGFFPMRDMFSSCCCCRSPLPDVAEHFAADTGLARRASGHHATRRREDVRPQPSEHRRHIVDTQIHATAWTADALDAGDNAFTVGAVFQEQADHLAGRPPFLHGLVDQPVALSVPLVLEDARNLGLQLARRHVYTRVLGGNSVADAREHVGNRIGHLCVSLLKPKSHI